MKKDIVIEKEIEKIFYRSRKNYGTRKIRHELFNTVDSSLFNINLFHTDIGSEFKNKTIENLLEIFGIKRSPSKKGCHYDNAIAEATFKLIKTEFANIIFKDFDELEYLLFDYVNWFNKFRIHSSLNYLSPVDFRLSMSE